MERSEEVLSPSSDDGDADGSNGDDMHSSLATRKTVRLCPRKQPETCSSSKGGKRELFFNEATIRGLFHLSINDAALELGVGATSLKRVCRRLGIRKWPYRRARFADLGPGSYQKPIDSSSSPYGDENAETRGSTASDSKAAFTFEDHVETSDGASSLSSVSTTLNSVTSQISSISTTLNSITSQNSITSSDGSLSGAHRFQCQSTEQVPAHRFDSHSWRSLPSTSIPLQPPTHLPPNQPPSFVPEAQHPTPFQCPTNGNAYNQNGSLDLAAINAFLNSRSIALSCITSSLAANRSAYGSHLPTSRLCESSSSANTVQLPSSAPSVAPPSMGSVASRCRQAPQGMTSTNPVPGSFPVFGSHVALAPSANGSPQELLALLSQVAQLQAARRNA
eukprot:CAMPEP_0181343160 /NCGR_PEP_ID=MMETSP1101-20121128/31430_1 /TAXON_ID=46948 /ORGANISM="Rhodomonas abbreviata, Strain Caron Lab Isolate" /LENGTH=391 /DNA_ID=CAMNT_0023454755 /DNA_START=115 /DNA_END=1290 /DNA_ORIENTATION=+